MNKTMSPSSEIRTDSAAGVLLPTIPNREKILQVVIPVVALLIGIQGWRLLVTVNQISRYILPGPVDVVIALFIDSATLWPAILVTLRITFMALALALIDGVGLAILIMQSRLLELTLFPFAVVLQVTPIIAIAPLPLIYAPHIQAALLICAFLAAFFPADRKPKSDEFTTHVCLPDHVVRYQHFDFRANVTDFLADAASLA